jgi:hypothetical protein
MGQGVGEALLQQVALVVLVVLELAVTVVLAWLGQALLRLTEAQGVAVAVTITMAAAARLVLLLCA